MVVGARPQRYDLSAGLSGQPLYRHRRRALHFIRWPLLPVQVSALCSLIYTNHADPRRRARKSGHTRAIRAQAAVDVMSRSSEFGVPSSFSLRMFPD